MGTANKWSADAGSAIFGSPFAKTGSKALFGRGDLSSSIDASAKMVNLITIPADASLRFDHAFEFEPEAGAIAYDGGIVEYSIGASGTWAQVPALADGKGYLGAISSSSGNPLGGKSAFSGPSHGYVSTRFDLSALAGQAAKFRWRVGTDDSVASTGWWVDNVQVYTCVAGPARIAQTGTTYTAIQPAYAAAATGYTIQVQAGTYTEILVFGRPVFITLTGGFDSGYTTNPGSTVVAGRLTISNGTVIIDNLAIK